MPFDSFEYSLSSAKPWNFAPFARFSNLLVKFHRSYLQISAMSTGVLKKKQTPKQTELNTSRYTLTDFFKTQNTIVDKKLVGNLKKVEVKISRKVNHAVFSTKQKKFSRIVILTAEKCNAISRDVTPPPPGKQRFQNDLKNNEKIIPLSSDSYYLIFNVSCAKSQYLRVKGSQRGKKKVQTQFASRLPNAQKLMKCVLLNVLRLRHQAGNIGDLVALSDCKNENFSKKKTSRLYGETPSDMLYNHDDLRVTAG